MIHVRPGPAWLAIASVVAGGMLAFVLVVPVVPGTASGSYGFPGTCVYCPAELPPTILGFPAGARVTVVWSESGGSSVTFLVSSSPVVSNGTTACRQTGSGGTCTFVASGSHYTFLAMCPCDPVEGWYLVNYTASYWSPVV